MSDLSELASMEGLGIYSNSTTTSSQMSVSAGVSGARVTEERWILRWKDLSYEGYKKTTEEIRKAGFDIELKFTGSFQFVVKLEKSPENLEFIAALTLLQEAVGADFKVERHLEEDEVRLKQQIMQHDKVKKHEKLVDAFYTELHNQIREKLPHLQAGYGDHSGHDTKARRAVDMNIDFLRTLVCRLKAGDLTDLPILLEKCKAGREDILPVAGRNHVYKDVIALLGSVERLLSDLRKALEVSPKIKGRQAHQRLYSVVIPS